ncbi:MAG: hypothetical protein QOI11_2360 [Candidatus Eremiobacteraeota bacterium]|jgi:hypothetical protein|nr:hypothetical protein [Candidatus Eremiobacteraeota bacterium]
MPTEYRFDDLDLREEPATVAKLDEEQDGPSKTCYVNCGTPPVPLY